MKFDCVIGNPPFQSKNKGDYSYWARFIQKSVELCKDNGHLSLITPSGWMSPTADIRKGRVKVLSDIFAKWNLIFVEVSNKVKNYFDGVGSSFSWFVLVKNDKYNQTKISSDIGIHNIDIRGVPFFPLDNNPIGISIIQKVCSSGSRKFSFKRNCCNFNGLNKQRGRFEFTNGNTNHLNEPYFGDVKCKYFNSKKVFIPYNGTKYCFIISDKDQVGITNGYVYELLNSDTVDGARSFFNSKLVKYIVSHKRTQYNEGAVVNSIPIIDLSKVWTDEELYQKFNLNQEEIDYIENNIVEI